LLTFIALALHRLSSRVSFYRLSKSWTEDDVGGFVGSRWWYSDAYDDNKYINSVPFSRCSAPPQFDDLAGPFIARMRSTFASRSDTVGRAQTCKKEKCTYAVLVSVPSIVDAPEPAAECRERSSQRKF